MKAVFCVFVFLAGIFGASTLAAQSAHKHLRKGDKSYRTNEFGKAEESYRKADELGPTSRGTYNLGNSIYQQGRYGEAVTHFQAATEGMTETIEQAIAYHNLGNALFQEGDLEGAQQAFQEALKRSPEDLSTKYNLAMVNSMLRQQDPPPPSPQDQPQNDPNQENQEQNQDQQQDQQQQPQGEPENQPQDQQQEKQPLSREEALQLLKVMDQEEQKVQEKIKRDAKKRPRPEKDW